MAKIFLTGEIQIGKSTVLTKTLTLLNITPRGFKTYFGPDRASSNKLLYMNYAAAPHQYSPEMAVAQFTNQAVLPLTEKFDTFGTELVRSARTAEQLIVMDECGVIERDALLFQAEILDTLDSPNSVLGVIKLSSQGSWTDKIINHPQVQLLTVTEENRDALPDILAEEFRRMFSPPDF